MYCVHISLSNLKKFWKNRRVSREILFLTSFSGIVNEIAPRELSSVSQNFEGRLRVARPKSIPKFESEKRPHEELFEFVYWPVLSHWPGDDCMHFICAQRRGFQVSLCSIPYNFKLKLVDTGWCHIGLRWWFSRVQPQEDVSVPLYPATLTVCTNVKCRQNCTVYRSSSWEYSYL